MITATAEKEAIESKRSNNEIKDRMRLSERRFRETGLYDGIGDLTLKKKDPLRYESVHSRLRSLVVSARETSKRISASPGIREVGESVVALYTPEGDSIVLSMGIMVHVHTMSRFIKWMIENDYEIDPGIRPGDIFANNDAYIGNVQTPDVMDVIPIFYDGEIVGWAGAVCHELEVGGVTAGGDVYLAQERYTEGLFVCAEKVGANDQLRRDYLLRVERNVRTPIYWILDEKAKVSACLEIREKVLEIIRDIGVEYYKQVTKELIEEGRRSHLERMKLMTVPGRYRGATFFGHLYKGKPGVLPMADNDLLVPIPVELTIDRDGMMSLDFEGTGPWGFNSNNCCEAAMEGGFFVSLTQFMDYDGKVNDGAWLTTKMNLPPGTWTNPGRISVATACSWALLLPAFGTFQRLLSRAFLARGFKEEIFVGQVNTPFFEGGGMSQYGSWFGGSNFELASGGSGARAILDGLDHGYAGWNPEADMGNAEIWELSLPILYLGRQIWPDSAGAGKFRGGSGFTSTYMIHGTPMFMLTTAIHSGRVFDNGGLCGGYPAPTAIYHYAVRDTNLKKLIEEQKPLPHYEGIDPRDPDVFRLVEGDKEFTEGGYIGRPFKSYDLFEHFYNSGGGYGDILERDPKLVLEDVENGYVTRRAAAEVYGVVIREDEKSRRLVLENEATRDRRDALRAERRANAIPVRQWIEKERSRIEIGEFVPEIREAYRESMRLSKKWAREFRDFWSLPESFEF
jgi:acetone carboxylase, alpha subunit